MRRPTPIREVLTALEWARVQAMQRGSPDFVRQRVIQERVQRLCEALLRRDRRRDA